MGLKTLLSFLLAVGSVRAQIPDDDTTLVLATQTGRFIVEFSEGGASKLRKRDGRIDARSFVVTIADTLGTPTTAAHTFDSAIFRGVSLDVGDSNETSIAQIQALPEVANVWPAGIVTTSAEVVTTDVLPGAIWDPHSTTGVDELHQKGFNGSGSIVAIVDSGIDYNHPDLGGGFGPGFKVESGWDLVGDSYDVGSPLTPDADPFDCNGHGTHVAGIIASSNSLVPGVAPNARLRSYKVFGCGGSTSEDNVMAALIQAYEEGADIITASLGSILGFPTNPTAVVASRIQAAGTFVSVAAGNSGDRGGAYRTSSVANGFDVTTVGSTNGVNFIAYFTTATSSNGETRQIIYMPDSRQKFDLSGTFEAHFYNDTRTRDVCNYLAKAPKVPDEEILLLRRGDCALSMTDMQLNDRVKWVFIYNPEGSDNSEYPTRIITTPDTAAKGFALISYDDGMWLLDQYEAGLSVTYEFSEEPMPISIPWNGYGANAISSYSAWGPTLDARMKPEILAPGGVIFSTYPVAGGSYAVLSGTSMATPYIAGIAAVFFSSRGGRAPVGSSGATALVAHKRLTMSGSTVASHLSRGGDAPPAKAGAGLVNAAKVVEYATSVDPAYINVNDTEYFNPGPYTINIINEGDEDVTYTISHVPGGATQGIEASGGFPSLEPGVAGHFAIIELSTETLTVPAGSTATFTATFAQPTTGNPANLWAYAGGLIVNGSNAESVKVSYMGVLGNLKDAAMWDMSRGMPLWIDRIDPTSGNHYELYDGLEYELKPYGDVPKGYYNVLWPTEELSFDYVGRDWNESDWVYPPVAGENNWFGSCASAESNYPHHFHQVITGGMYAVPGQNYSDGRPVLPGEYRLLGRTHKTYGNKSDIAGGWQYKVSPWFRMKWPEPSNETTTTTTTMSSTTTPTVTTTAAPPPPLATCGESVPVDLKAAVVSDGTSYSLAPYSDFLAYDQLGSATQFSDFALTSEGWLLTRDPTTGVDKFFSVHTNNNSLIYVYPESSISGAFSKLLCTETDAAGRLSCVSGAKSMMYSCSSQNVNLLRHGPEVLDGCFEVQLAYETLEQNCGGSSAVVPSVSATTTGSPAVTIA